eukprot:PhM_4_TR1898/c0_g3_i1/m.38061
MHPMLAARVERNAQVATKRSRAHPPATDGTSGGVSDPHESNAKVVVVSDAATSSPLVPVSPPSWPASFTRLEKLGEGTFGAVYRCRDRNTGRIVAVKKLPWPRDEDVSQNTVREISVLSELDHPNVVRIEGIEVLADNVFVAMTYVSSDLHSWIRERRRCNPTRPYTLSDVRGIVFQLLRGTAYCHARGIIHRDVKPQNILVSEDASELRLIDFGLTREVHVPITAEMTTHVVTVWYRPPELLLGSPTASFTVDTWSIGLVLVELLQMGRPLVPGDCDIDQILQIFKLFGTPDGTTWPGVDTLPNFQAGFPKWSRRPWLEVCPELADVRRVSGDDDFASLIELLDGCLTLDPSRRWTPRRAIESPWFDAVRDR